MKITKIIKTATTTNIKPELHNIYVTPDTIASTNCYSLLVYKNKLVNAEKIPAGVYARDLFKKEMLGYNPDTETITYKDLTQAVFKPIPDLEYPDFNRIIPAPDAVQDPIEFDIDYFINLLDALKEQKHTKFKLLLNKDPDTKPTMIQAGDITAIIMPIRK
jgi:hypothetical protein